MHTEISLNFGISNGACYIKTTSNGVKLQFLTMEDCIYCQKGKKIIEEIKPDFPDLEIEEIDMTTLQGQEMIQKYQIMSSPAILIDGELFSTGCPNKEKLIKRLKGK